MDRNIKFSRIFAAATLFAACGAVAVLAESKQNAFVTVTAPKVEQIDGRDFRVQGTNATIRANPGWRLRAAPTRGRGGAGPLLYTADDSLSESSATGAVHTTVSVTNSIHISSCLNESGK